MRLGVNARRLAGQRLGVARYIEYLLKYWAAMLLPHETVTLYVQESVDIGNLRLPEAFRLEVLTPRMTGILWENFILARAVRNVDVLFCPSYTVPLTYPGPCVVSIHSVNEAFPGTHPWWYGLTYAQWYRRSADKASRVVVPSQAVRSDIHRLYDIPLEKIEVVHQGADDTFRPVDNPPLRRAVREKYFGDDRPFVVWVGKLSQRRNLPVLMEAFALLHRRYQVPHGLLLVGPNHLGLPLDRLARDLGITDRFVQTDGEFDSHSELVGIYNAADLYVCPSSYEGFSMTLVEAMACGTPVVTVNRGALREIAEGCALMVDEPMAEPLAEAMYRMLTDHSLRDRLRARGLERARALRWEEAARRTLETLRQVGEHSGRSAT